jgi:hypothetical protein
MKRLAFILALLIGFSASVTLNAQPQGKGGFGNMKPEDRAKMITERMKEELKLNADQEKKVSEINLRYAKKNQEARKAGDEAAVRKAMDANNAARDGEFKKILTADQFKTYQKMVQEMKARQAGKPRN